MNVRRPWDRLLKLTNRKRRKRLAAKSAALKKAEFLRPLVVTEENRLEGLFDSEWYASTYPDVVEGGQDPFFHYINHGYNEDRDPGPNFDAKFYRSTYPDVVAAGVPLLLHYLRTGRAEGRSPNARASRSERTDEVRHVFVKEMKFPRTAEIAVLVTHAPSGRLKPHVLPYIQKFQESGLSVLLVVVVDRPLELRAEELSAADGIIVRDNTGYDFGAWAHALQLYPSLFGANLLVLTNDSVIPTADSNIFRATIERVRDAQSDIVGLTASHEYGWHIQSYFLALKPKALSSWTFQHFIRDMKLINDKNEVIRAYEIPFAGKMRAAGLTIDAIFTGPYSANPTFFGWKELIYQGFPFIKLLMLRKKFAEDTDQLEILEEVQQSWPTILGAAGFDLDLVRASIRAAEISSVPRDSNNALLIDSEQYENVSHDHVLRIAYFGPWNYENGLGVASREMLCALRYTDTQINAYPVVKPFHVHRLICPSVATLDFTGRPDVAIVHLNPDSWNVLTTEQREIIRSAKRRIGYWVWETDRLPASWQREINSVDRIWAPSSYCADVFSAEVSVPVDVVPHPVRVPTRIASDRQSVLRRFGIDPQSRVILYIFDGASYLVRKNPHALIRAFAESRLEAEGWILLLKTKHLYDRPDAGNALLELVNRTPGVQLIDVSLYADEVTSLLAAVDIYASPHCSEGFGLTVAEAMAIGKSVVATDYSGTRDFLNDSCGYPVPAELWALEENHGHYLAGHSWAKIDEAALSMSLIRAAKATTDGDKSFGEAAKENIERLLSYDAVAKTIRLSISTLVAQEGISNRTSSSQTKTAVLNAPPEIAVKYSSAKRFQDNVASQGLVWVSLANDLSWDGTPIPEGEPNDWIVFAPGLARTAPDATHFFLSSSTDRPDVTLFYADDVAAGEDSLNRVRLKPDFDQTLFVSQDYIGAPVCVRRWVLEDLGGLNQTRGTAVLYDLILRVAEAGAAIARIPEVLLGYEDKRPSPHIEERRASLAARKGLANVDFLDGFGPGELRQRRRLANTGYPGVTIAVPTKRTLRPGSTQTYIERLLHGIAAAAWPLEKITVIIGDDLTDEPDWAARSWPFILKRIETAREAGEHFNYAAKMNRLWRAASDDQIIFMNDDVIPNGPDWLNALTTFSLDERVGGVGARLYYEDGSVQHAGMFPAFRTVAHAWLGWPPRAATYQNWAACQREWSMVTGAVFATRRSILERVNGFDERFSLEFNDVDLCLRIRNLGYRIVYDPSAEFTHVEKASRGERIPPGDEIALFLSRWSRWLEQDPASHPLLAKNRMDLVADVAPDAWYI